MKWLCSFLVMLLLSGSAVANPKGINHDPLIVDSCVYGCQMDTALPPQDLAVIAQLGVTIVRFQYAAYPLIQTPTNSSTNNSLADSNLNTMLSDLHAAGLTPLLTIAAWCYAPTANSTPCTNAVTGTTEPVGTRAAYEAWLTNLVLTSGVTYFEIGNEPNLNAYVENNSPGKKIENNPDVAQSGWNIPDCQLDYAGNTLTQCNNQTGNDRGANASGACPNGSPTTNYTNAVLNYIQFLQDSYTTIKAANPNAKVLLGGVSSWRGVCFMDLLAKYGAFNYADIVSFHAYPLGSTPQDGASTALYMMGKTTLPVWITEFGWDVGTGGSEVMRNEQAKADNVGTEWALLEQEGITGPIMLWSARDGLTDFDWNTPNDTLPITNYHFGVYEWTKPCNNNTFVCTVNKLPSFSVYQGLQ